MKKRNLPTRVTVLDRTRILLEVADQTEARRIEHLGFRKMPDYSNIYQFSDEDSSEIFRLCDLLRKQGVPFSTHRMGGADYVVETLREAGHLSGKFKRINFFGRDRDPTAPFAIEEF